MAETQAIPNNGMYGHEAYREMWQRSMKAYQANMGSALNGAISRNDARNNSFELDQLSDELMRLRPLFGKRLPRTGNEVTDILSADPARTAGLFMAYAAKSGGIKGFNGPITPEVLKTLDPKQNLKDLKDPGIVVREMRDFHWGNGTSANNKNLELLADAAGKTQNAQMAAIMIKESGAGWGANDKILDKIFKESASHMSEAEHNRFLSDTNAAFKQITGGKNVNDFIRDQYGTFGLFVSVKGRQYIQLMNYATSYNQNSGSNTTAMMGGIMPGMDMRMMPGMEMDMDMMFSPEMMPGMIY